MAFSYNPDEKEDSGGRAEEGTYSFKVDDITEKTFKSGNDGWAVMLLAAALEDKDVTVYDNLVNVPTALWKFEAFCNALGYDFANPPAGGYKPEQFVNRMGKARFVKNDRGYLAVDEYLPASAGSDSEDDVPF
jgi:hypothetical protein